VTFAASELSTPDGTQFTRYDLSYEDGNWVEVDGALPALTHTFTTAGDYTVILDAYNDANGHARSMTTVSVTDPDLTAPGPVTALTATVNPTSVALAWTNPADADFTGVIIRRAVGATAPPTASSGDPVADTVKTATSYTDTGLTPRTQYSYAAFAHDGVPNNAPAATLSVNTTPPPPTAALSINGFTGPTMKLTVDGAVASFDASGSLANGGATLESASLDYGDGTTDTFTSADSWLGNHVYTQTGPWTVTLLVTDTARLTDAVVVTVIVYKAPKTKITQIGTTAQVDVPVRFSLESLTPTGTNFTGYVLQSIGPQGTQNDGGDGPPPGIKDVTFRIPGLYAVQFSAVNDAGGHSEMAQIQVDVS
jgi:hypothetical protein